MDAASDKGDSRHIDPVCCIAGIPYRAPYEAGGARYHAWDYDVQLDLVRQVARSPLSRGHDSFLLPLSMNITSDMEGVKAVELGHKTTVT